MSSIATTSGCSAESPYRAAAVLRQARQQLAGDVSQERRAVPRLLRRRGHRPLRLPAAAATSATRKSYARREVDRLRSGAGRLSGRVRLRRAAGAQGHSAGRAAAGGGVPARAGGPADRHRSGRTVRVYHDFAARLAERGLRHLRPAEPVPLRRPLPHAPAQGQPDQERRSSRSSCRNTSRSSTWLGGLPFVDPRRIAFYGLSYGGKTAMRVPPLVPGYCLSICSGDFNEWVWKNASSRQPYSYVWTGEYEIFEFDLGSTFNYAEMAALDRPAAVHGRARAFRRRGPGRSRGLRVRQGPLPVRGAAEARRPLPASNGSSARTRSTARARSISCTNNSPGRNPGETDASLSCILKPSSGKSETSPTIFDSVIGRVLGGTRRTLPTLPGSRRGRLCLNRRFRVY